MAKEEDREEAAERVRRALETATSGKDAPSDEEEDLRTRFPDPDSDERLRVPRGEALPEVPEAQFTRPSLPQADTGKGSAGLSPLKADMRGMGEASTIGITLAASIAVGTGLGWLVDRYLLKSSGTPWGLIVGFLLGTTSGFVNLVRVAGRLNKDGDR